MSRPCRAPIAAARRPRQRGAAAVELAVLMLATVVLMVPTFVIGRTLWQYNVLKHATYDAARYLAAVPAHQFDDPAVPARAKLMVAQALIAAGVAPASSQAALMGQVDVICPNVPVCAGVPETILVQAYFSINDPAALSMTGRVIKLPAFSTVRYGN